MVQFLAFALDDRSPALILAEGLELERAAAHRDVETKIRIEPLRRRKIRHGEHKMVQRMNAKPGPVRCRNISTHCCHCVFSDHTVAGAKPTRTLSTSLAASLNG